MKISRATGKAIISLALFLGAFVGVAQGGAGRDDALQTPDPSFTNHFGMTFVFIRAGSFLMGSHLSEAGRDDDERLHRVTLTRGFYLQTTEVTQGQWRQVMGDNPSKFSGCGSDCPVEQVSWNDAQRFIQKLNQIGGRVKYRLPTEAEWEYAARAGTETAFYWGNEVGCSKANYGSGYILECKGKNPGQTMRVGSFPPNPWGLHDMHGNVWEWCQDWYGADPSGSVTTPERASSGLSRVLRGGGWRYFAWACRSANRHRSRPGSSFDSLGFRVAGDPARLLEPDGGERGKGLP